MDSIPQIEFFREGSEIVGVGVHVIAIPGLVRSAVPAPVMRGDAVAGPKNNMVPVVGTERPAVTEPLYLPFAPVFVTDGGAFVVIVAMASSPFDRSRGWAGLLPQNGTYVTRNICHRVLSL